MVEVIEILGNCYDLMGRHDFAVSIYKQGLERI